VYEYEWTVQWEWGCRAIQKKPLFLVRHIKNNKYKQCNYKKWTGQCEDMFLDSYKKKLGVGKSDKRVGKKKSLFCLSQSINHLYSHKPYTTVQRRHKYTYNKYRIDILWKVELGQTYKSCPYIFKYNRI
jgi:hypothetical protein